MDELGSGILNVNRLIKEYAGGGTPQFVEGVVFKILLPVPEIGSEGLNEGLKSVLQIIKDHPGIQARIISEQLNSRPIKTVERQIKTLIEKDLVERRGSRRTGGYYLRSVQ